MVSKEMRKWGKPVVTLAQKEYGKLEGLLKECLPNHIPIDIERVGDKIKLWSRHPRVIVKAVEKARGMLKKYGFEAMAVRAAEKTGDVVEKFIEPKEKPVVKKKKVAKKKPVKKKPTRSEASGGSKKAKLFSEPAKKAVKKKAVKKGAVKRKTAKKKSKKKK